MKDAILKIIEKVDADNPFDKGFMDALTGWENACEQIKKDVEKFDPWISVEDRLPDYPVNELCLAVNAMGIIDKVRHYGGKRFIDHDGNDFYAIYWQPLPSPPNTK